MLHAVFVMNMVYCMNVQFCIQYFFIRFQIQCEVHLGLLESTFRRCSVQCLWWMLNTQVELVFFIARASPR